MVGILGMEIGIILHYHGEVRWTNSLYVDGIQEDSGTIASGVTVEKEGSLVLGYEQDDVGGGFESYQGLIGSIDELIITDTFMNASSIISLYHEYKLSPSGLIILPGSEFIDLSWDPVDDPEFDHYNIYRVDPVKVHNGLIGMYYNNSNLTDLIGVRVDGPIDFDWESGSPMDGVDDNTFSITWNGYLKVDHPGGYDLFITSDDGARLWVDGDLIIDDWNNHASSENEASISLDRGFHRIRLDYFDNSLYANIKMEVDGPSFPRMTIPGSSLFSFNITDMEKIGTSTSTNFRDSSLGSENSYFYQVTYSTGGGDESSPSDIVGGTPSVPSTLKISPNEVKATLGQTLDLEVTVGNDARFKDWFELSVKGPYSDWVLLEKEEFLLEPGRRAYVDMEITIPLNSSEGIVRLDLEMVSDLNEVYQVASVWIDISTDPVILELRPFEGFRSGSTDIMVTWETVLTTTSKVFIREKGESDYSTFNGSDGKHHIVNITGLTRETVYEFYVESVSPYGSTQSKVRSILVDNGVKFKSPLLVKKVKRDYDQSIIINVVNTDDELHNVIVTVDNPYDDLIVGFVGSGSTDRALPVLPGMTSYLNLAVHAQDAKDIEHRLYLNLTTIPKEGEETLRSYAILKVELDHVFVNLTIAEISTDPYTLTKRIKIDNVDDIVTDLRVYAEDEYASYLNMEPVVQHGYLPTGGSLEVDIYPQLTFSFIPFTSRIFISAYDKIYQIDLDFSPPEGWDIFCASLFPNWGGFPFVEIPDNDMDIDGILDAEDDDIDGDGSKRSGLDVHTRYG